MRSLASLVDDVVVPARKKRNEDGIRRLCYMLGCVAMRDVLHFVRLDKRHTRPRPTVEQLQTPMYYAEDRKMLFIGGDSSL